MTFDEAQRRVKRLKKTPNPSELLRLYSHFKQGTLGDALGKRPGLLDMRGRAKFDAWKVLVGMSQEDAQRTYIDIVGDLIARYGEN